jgi:tetratricopeptide (TPR) repeat protein
MAVLGLTLLGLGFAGIWLATRFDPSGRVQAAYDRREYRTALQAATIYLEWHPGDRRASLMAARCLTRTGQARLAETFYQKAGALGLDDLHARAYALTRVDEPVAAGKVYDELLSRWPDDPLALKRQAAVRMGLRQWDKVFPLAERLAKVPGEEIAARTLEAIVHHESKQYVQAIGAFERVLQLDPSLKVMPLPHPLFWKNLAVDLMAEGRAAEARSYLERALGHTEDGGLMELLGLSYHQEGRVETAEHWWRKAVEREPGNADAWLDLGHLALNRRQWSEAVVLLTRAAELSPEAVEPLHNLAQAYQMLGKTAEAAQYRRKAADRRAAHPPAGGMGAMPVPAPESSR